MKRLRAVGVALAVAAPCVAPADGTGAVPVLTQGLNHFYFRDWAGPELEIWVYVPWGVEPAQAPVMMMMHGAKRAPARYLAGWDTSAEQGGFIVVAPEFSREKFPTSQTYNTGNVFTGESMQRQPEAQWSFSAIEPLFDTVVAALDGVQTDYTLYGHSAGSQFVHRYLYFKPGARIRRVIAANAGWYTLPDLDVPFPYGLGGTGLTAADLRSVLQKDVVVLLGSDDDDPGHETLRRTPEAMHQGRHRLARGRTFFRTAERRAAELGIELGWQLHVVDGVAHSNAGIAAAAAAFVGD